MTAYNSIHFDNAEDYQKAKNLLNQGENGFDLNQVIPMPECLKDSFFKHNSGHYFIYILNGETWETKLKASEDNYKFICRYCDDASYILNQNEPTMERAQQIIDAIFEQPQGEEMDSETIEQLKKGLKNYEQTGFYSYFDWEYVNWGTGYGPRFPEWDENDLCVKFETYYEIPEKAITALMQKLSLTGMVASYDDNDTWDFEIYFDKGVFIGKDVLKGEGLED